MAVREAVIKTMKLSKELNEFVIGNKLSRLWQQLLISPLERGAGGVLRQIYTPLYPLFLEGNHKGLKFLYIKLKVDIYS